MLQLLRPNSSNLPCLYSTFHLEYPLVLSRFCLTITAGKVLNFCIFGHLHSDSTVSIDREIFVFVLSVVNFSFARFLNRKRRGLYICRAYSTYETLSNDTNINDLMTWTVTFVLIIAFSDFLVFHKHILFVKCSIVITCCLSPVNSALFDILDVSETAYHILTKLNSKQVLNVL